MKILKFFGIGLMSLTLCAGFASCSDDDDEPAGNNEKPSGELSEFSKRLTMYERVNTKAKIRYHYSYDPSSGWLSEYFKDVSDLDSDAWDIWETKNFEYAAKELKVVGSSDKYVLDANGKVAKFVSEDGKKVCAYTYLPNGLLSNCKTTNSQGENTREVSLKWDGTRLVQCTLKYHTKDRFSIDDLTSVYDLKYGGQKAIGAYAIVLEPILLNPYVEFACPNVVGIYLDELPVSITCNLTRTRLYNDKVDGKQHKDESIVLSNFTFSDVEITKDKYLKKVTYNTDEKGIDRRYNYDANGDGKISQEEEMTETEMTNKVSSVYTFTWEPKKKFI